MGYTRQYAGYARAPKEKMHYGKAVGRLSLLTEELYR